MIEQIKEFIRYKNCDLYKINDEEIVARSYPEDYDFTRKENNVWVYGASHRDKDKIVKIFKTEEEALLCMLYILYTIEISIKIKEGKDWSSMTKEQLIKELDDPDINEFTNRIEILNDEQLIYDKKYPIDNKYSKDKKYSIDEIDEYRLIALYKLKAFEMTRKELIEFGIDELQLEKYYKYENLVIGVY